MSSTTLSLELCQFARWLPQAFEFIYWTRQFIIDPPRFEYRLPYEARCAAEADSSRIISPLIYCTSQQYQPLFQRLRDNRMWPYQSLPSSPALQHEQGHDYQKPRVTFIIHQEPFQPKKNLRPMDASYQKLVDVSNKQQRQRPRCSEVSSHQQSTTAAERGRSARPNRRGEERRRRNRRAARRRRRNNG